MGDPTPWEWREALATVSSLKRAMGIKNHPRKDEMIDGQLHIYLQDSDSAELIGELLFRYGNGKRARFYDSHPEIHTLRDSIRVEQLPDGGYDASMTIVHPTHFSRMVQKMIDKHISPDKTFTR